MEKVWLKHYPEGMPSEIDPREYPSLVHLLEESFQKHASRRAFVCMDKALTYGELDRLSRQLGAWLQSRGLQPKARVALMMPNVLQYPVALAAVLRAGYTVVNVNPLYTPRELEHQLKDSGAEAIILLENFAGTLQKVVDTTAVRHVVVASMGDLLGGVKGTIVNFVVRNVKKLVPAWSLTGHIRFNTALSEGQALSLQKVELKPEDVAFLQYTGGTTGVSKGATLLHRNVVANVLQSEAWMQPSLRKGAPIEQIITITALPLYHIFALTVCCMLVMRSGGMAVLIPNARDIRSLIRDIRKWKFHMLPAVNTLYNALLHHPEFDTVDFSQLRVANGGGMAVQEAVARKWLERTKCPIVEGYGLSETSPTVSCNPTDTDRFTGTIGLPVPSTELELRDDDGKPVPLGEPGEICVRGPQVMAGYWNQPGETARVMYADGFLKTGDIGVMDERGYTKIVDRKKDMILVSGFNVFPNEIEGVVVECPGVLEAAAVGVPDEHSGEVVKLFVVKRDPALTEQTVREFCKERLTGYKRPKHIEFRSELPKTNVGKILRRELKEKKSA
ncbi:long-chain fatty acid--CoA ligase [Hyalangium rubrum]|uniref:Long-chain-fatty-acid--CoA ligase n=1 Tax=Hyalangium rubrum TaxID=3103134 RepID=A0ABU5HCM9_9BACT|nr:long-chain fatty acid--CoA ligase [Hyalangium sp. s54d21]MDY7231214.1 long-chain fatty acid--CoA ligase [Hyalangium sp. s54d21]